MASYCLSAIWNVHDSVQDVGHFIAETQNGHRIMLNTIFTYFYN